MVRSERCIFNCSLLFRYFHFDRTCFYYKGICIFILMTIQERNEQWLGSSERIFIHPKNGGRYWSIIVDDNKITVQHGKLNGKLPFTHSAIGKLTSASETLKDLNIGKSNQKPAYLVALDKARETIRKKHLEGYVEHKMIRFGEFEPIEEAVSNVIDFDNLPSTLCFYKPHNTVEGALLKKMEAGKVLYSRKRNGAMVVIAKGTGPAKLYSRRMLRSHDDEVGKYTWDDRFPHIIKAANSLPDNTILTGELVVDKDGQDDFKMTQRLTKSTTPDALELQKELKENKWNVLFYVWDIPFWKGEDQKEKTTRTRYGIMNHVIASADIYADALLQNDYYDPNFFSLFTPLDFSTKNKWEGWVVVDPEGVYGEKMYNFKGKPDRPRSMCGKLKAIFEDDVIVNWDPANGIGEFSLKDKYDNGKPGIKSVMMYQYDSAGKLIPISQLGVGLTEEMRINLADPKLFPQVWQVGYSDRRYISSGDDTNAMDFAKFLAFRPDKDPKECLNENI